MTTSRVYIITGASRGLGEALASRLLQPENRLLCLARTRSVPLAREAEAAGVRLDWFECDLAALAAEAGTEALMRELLERAEPETAQCLRLINNAGMLDPIGPAHANDAAAISRHIAVNLTAPIALTGAFLRLTGHLQADKRVLQMSSGAGRHPYAGWSVYCAAKAGLDHYTRCVKLEQEALPYGAKVASVAPGVVDTAMQALIRESDESRFPSHARFVQLHESGGLASPQEAAAQLVALLEHPDFGVEPIVDIRNWKP